MSDGFAERLAEGFAMLSDDEPLSEVPEDEGFTTTKEAARLYGYERYPNRVLDGVKFAEKPAFYMENLYTEDEEQWRRVFSYGWVGRQLPLWKRSV